jgi:hypothetical protein
VFSPGICWSGLILNLYGWEVQALQMNSYGVRPLRVFSRLAKEIAQVGSQLLVGIVEVAFHSCVFDGAVHSLDLPIGPWVLGLGQTMIDVVLGACVFEGVRPDGFRAHHARPEIVYASSADLRPYLSSPQASPSAPASDRASCFSRLASDTSRPPSEAAEAEAGARTLTVPWTPPSPYRKREIIQGVADARTNARPIRANARAILIDALRDAHRWVDELLSDPRQTLVSLASREVRSERSIRMTLSLAFLAPDIVKASVEGRLPRGYGIKRLVDLPMAWPDQWRALGLQGPARA